MKHRMSGDLIIPRRNLDTDRILLAWVNRLVAKRTDVPRVRY